MHPIFSHPQHTTDQYALTFSIFFKKAPVNGNDLIFGNDFDRSLRDRLPPGINTAIRLVKWSIDPSMDGDVYADKPYLFSPALASWNQFRIGDKVRKGVEEVPKVGDVVVEEGADGDEGWGIREEHGIPGDNRNNDKGNGSARMKHFQNEEARKKFVFEEGRKYWVNFGNPYLCFNGQLVFSIPSYVCSLFVWYAYPSWQISPFIFPDLLCTLSNTSTKKTMIFATC